MSDALTPQFSSNIHPFVVLRAALYGGRQTRDWNREGNTHRVS